VKFSSQIKLISYLKAHTAAIIRSLSEHGRSLVITQNGEAKAVTQDVASYEQTQETLALLKILALGNCQILEALKGQNLLAPWVHHLGVFLTELPPQLVWRSGQTPSFVYSTSSKYSFSASHHGQTQSAGISSKRVPGWTPCSVSPSSGSYT